MTLDCWKCGAAPAAAPSCRPDVFDFKLAPASGTPSRAMNLNQLLTSNDVPSAADMLSITAILAAEQEEADALDPQIAELEVTLDHLVRRRQKHLEVIRQHRAVLSPVRRVPPELLCEIFTLTRPGAEAAAEPPWRLGHICQSWRRAVLWNPLFWNSITIPNLLGAPTYDPAPSRIDIQLLRSANTPLTVYWCAEMDNGIDLRSSDAVLSHCGRWSGLHLDITCGDADLSWLTPASGRLTALRTLSLEPGDPRPSFPDILSVVPSLREVTLSNRYFTECSPDVIIPWGQITHYRGVYLEAAQREVLAAASGLLQCAVSFWGPPMHNGIPITLSRLRCLCVDGLSELTHFTTPSLEELFTVCSTRHNILEIPPSH
ncbi:hypothetical protein DFH06DRAFT_97536 [Mycena polygramma]|nr:hypothetical protein DFH06DRAFT_97536 [Mycena polygramma]